MLDPLPTGYYVAAFAVAALCVLGPLLAVVLSVRRGSVRLLVVVAGGITFAVSQLVLRLPTVDLVQQLAPGWVAAQAVVWLLLLSLSAGVFEEVGRWVAFRFALTRSPDTPATPLGFGLGHGGVEAAVLVGFSVAATAVTLLVLQTRGTDALPPEAIGPLQAQRDALAGLGALGQLAAGYERVVAMAVHLGLSVLVFTSVRDRAPVLLLAAVLLHAGFNFVPGLLQQRVSLDPAGVWLVELVLTLAAAVVLVVVWLLVRRRRWADRPAPAAAS